MGNRLSIKIENKLNSVLKVTVTPVVGSADPAKYEWQVSALTKELKAVEDWKDLNMKFKARVEQNSEGKWELLHYTEVEAFDRYIVNSDDITAYNKSVVYKTAQR